MGLAQARSPPHIMLIWHDMINIVRNIFSLLPHLPEFAIDTIPAPTCFKLRVIWSSNFPPYMLSPPRPVPVGSPPCIMKSLIILERKEEKKNIWDAIKYYYSSKYIERNNVYVYDEVCTKIIMNTWYNSTAPHRTHTLTYEKLCYYNTQHLLMQRYCSMF